MVTLNKTTVFVWKSYFIERLFDKIWNRSSQNCAKFFITVSWKFLKLVQSN